MPSKTIKTIISNVDKTVRRILIIRELRFLACIAGIWIIIMALYIVIYSSLGSSPIQYLAGSEWGYSNPTPILALSIVVAPPIFVIFRLIFLRLTLAARINGLLLRTERITQEQYEESKSLIATRLKIILLIVFIAIIALFIALSFR